MANIPVKVIYRTSVSVGSPAYQKFRTDLHGALVTIDYVERAQVKIDKLKHAQFWKTWIDDNQGKVLLIHLLQG